MGASADSESSEKSGWGEWARGEHDFPVWSTEAETGMAWEPAGELFLLGD